MKNGGWKSGGIKYGGRIKNILAFHYICWVELMKSKKRKKKKKNEYKFILFNWVEKWDSAKKNYITLLVYVAN